MKAKRKGFTQVPNGVLEKLCNGQLTAKQLRVMLLTLRYSTGFHKEKASMPQKKYFEICGISSKEVKDDDGPIGRLQKLNVLERFSHDQNGIKYKVNPNVDEWKVPLAIQARGGEDAKESEEQRRQRLERYESELRSLAVEKKRREKPP